MKLDSIQESVTALLGYFMLICDECTCLVLIHAHFLPVSPRKGDSYSLLHANKGVVTIVCPIQAVNCHSQQRFNSIALHPPAGEQWATRVDVIISFYNKDIRSTSSNAMAFVSPILGVGVQHPRQIHYPVIVQQPVIPVVPQPQFLLQPQVHVYQPPPMSIMVPTMVAQSPLFAPLYFVVASAQPLSDLPPCRADTHLPSGISLRVVFYGHPSDDGYTLPMCPSSTTYKESALPSRDSLLAEIATWAGHHGLSIRHPGGRIDPLRVKLYVLPKNSSSRGVLCGIHYEPGAGLVVPGDVVKMVKLGGIEEKDWEEALKETQKEGYEAIVAVDMGDGGFNTTSTAAVVSTPDAAMGGD